MSGLIPKRFSLVTWLGPSPKMRWRRKSYQSTTLLRLVKFLDLMRVFWVYRTGRWVSKTCSRTTKLFWFWMFISLPETTITRTESGLLSEHFTGATCCKAPLGPCLAVEAWPRVVHSFFFAGKERVIQQTWPHWDSFSSRQTCFNLSTIYFDASSQPSCERLKGVNIQRKMMKHVLPCAPCLQLIDLALEPLLCCLDRSQD